MQRPTRRTAAIVRAEPAPPVLAANAPACVVTPRDIAELDSFVDGARPKNTRLAYESDLAHFRAWCAGRGVSEALPASAETVMVYLKDMALGAAPRAEGKGQQPRGRDGRWSFATIQRRRGSIGKWHRMARLHDPTGDERVAEVMDSIGRRIGKAQRQVRPMLPDQLRAALLALPAPPALVDTRDAAVVLIAFALAGRRSEVASLDLADVEFTADGMLVNVGPSEAQPERRTKANQEGRREMLPVPTGDDPVTDPVAAVRRWIAARGTAPGPLFYGVSKHGRARATRMPAQRVAFIVKRFACLAGLPPELYSGHSLRAGFVTAADAADVPATAIMRQTRHKLVDTLRRYVRPEDGFKNHPGKGLL